MKRWIVGIALALTWTGPAAAQTADTGPTAQIVPAVQGQQIYLPTVDETAAEDTAAADGSLGVGSLRED